MRTPALFGVLILVAGCRSEPSSTPEAAADRAPTAASQPAATDPIATGSIATVNGRPVSRERFERELAQSRFRYEMARKEVQPELMDNVRRSLVRRLVEAEVVRQKAEAWKVAPSEEDIEVMWAEHRARFGTSDAFAAFLERSGTTEADLRNQFVDNLLMDRVRQRIADDLVLEPSVLKEYYDSHPTLFEQPESVRVAQILVSVPPGANVEQRNKRRAEAAGLLEQLRDGADFAKLAGEHSDGPARQRGGDLGFLARGRLVREVEDVAFGLEPGQMSDVIGSRFGFHIVRVLERRPERKLSFEEARPRLEQRLRGQRLRRAVHDELEAWKRQMDIELFEDTDLFSARPQGRAPKGPTGLSPEGAEKLKTGPGLAPKIDLGTGRPKGFVPADPAETDQVQD